MNFLGSSYDNSGALGASTWRHVKFIEQPKPLGAQRAGLEGTPAGPPASDVLNRTADSALAGDRFALGTDIERGAGAGRPRHAVDGAARAPTRARRATEFRWLMESDVCKHCTHAACLDVCPTGALFRTEFGTVVVQDDICNGCGYCVPACPFGVIDRRRRREGRRQERRHRPEVHALLRPAQGRPEAGLRAGLPDPVDPVRRRRRAARAGAGAGRRPARGRRARRPAVRREHRTTASAGSGRSSCCSTSPRSTACRRTRSSPPRTCRRCGARPGWPPSAMLAGAVAVFAGGDRR